MKNVRQVLVFVAVAAVVAGSAVQGRGQQRPDFTGGWTASKETPEGVAAAPSPVFGPRLWLDQKGDRLTVIRPVRDTAVVAAHTLDGAELRSRIPGAMCLGDAGTVTSVAWEGNTVVHRILGSIPPGASTPVPAALRHVFKKTAADRIQVESVMRVQGQTEPVPVATVYTRFSDPAPSAPAEPAAKSTPATLTRLGWLGGTWVGTLGTSTVEERWTPAGGGSMLATSRTVSSSGAVNAFEYLCIAERNGGLVYTAMPNGRSPATDFTLTAIDDTSATFENPTHNFPKMIKYAVRPDGMLEATISGAAGSKPTTFTFKKQ